MCQNLGGLPKYCQIDLFLLETNGPMDVFLQTFNFWDMTNLNVLQILAVGSRHKKRSQTLLAHFLLPLLWYAVYLGKTGGVAYPWTFGDALED